MNCSFCGDPATGNCTRLHLDWIIVLPTQIKSQDVIRWNDASLLVTSVRLRKDSDEVIVETAQAKVLHIAHLKLPVLVKRTVACGWPRCEFHCGKCMMYSESESRREALFGERKRKTRRANAVKPLAVPDIGEERQQQKNKRHVLSHPMEVTTPPRSKRQAKANP